MIWLELRCEHRESPNCYTSRNAGPSDSVWPDTAEGAREAVVGLSKQARADGWERMRCSGGGLGWHCPSCVEHIKQVEKDSKNTFENRDITVAQAALLLNVSITELKEAVNYEKPLRGVEPPKLKYRSGSKGVMMFRAGDVQETAEELKRQKA